MAGLGQVTIYQHNFAPHQVSAAFSATGGSGWSVTAYSFLLVAWYGPEGDESNVYQAGADNFGYNAPLTSIATSTETQTLWNKTPSAATDTMTITWTAPDGRTPHHYSIYWQLGVTYDIRNVGFKANSADIPPSTLSYEITTPGDNGTNTNAYIMAKSDGGNSVTVYGNILASCGVGTVHTLTGFGSATVESANLTFNARGYNTIITYSTAGAAAGISVGDTLVYKLGRAAFLNAGGTSPVWGARAVVVLAPINQFDAIPRDRFYRTYRNKAALKSLNSTNHIESLVVSVPTSGTVSYEQWAGTLQLMWKAGTTVWVIDQNDELTDTRYGTNPQYIGVITSLDYVGSLGKNQRGTFVVTIAVESDDIQSFGVTFDSP
jgi:hypothetical protein